MTAPEPKSRWIHKGCKRICVVVAVRGEIVEYRYVRTAGTEGLMPSRRTPTQMMKLDEWARLFTRKAA